MRLRRLLITGATGLLGQALAPLLAQAGAQASLSDALRKQETSKG